MGLRLAPPPPPICFLDGRCEACWTEGTCRMSDWTNQLVLITGGGMLPVRRLRPYDWQTDGI